MSGLSDFRTSHPEYNDIPDTDLADKLHAKFYSDMPKEDLYKELGLSVSPTAPLSGGGALPKAKGEAPESALEHITRAAGSAFDEPLGPSEQTIEPFVKGPQGPITTLNRALLQGGGAALDLAGRVGDAAIRGGAAAAAETQKAIEEEFPSAKKFLGEHGMTPGNLERDVYGLGQAAQIVPGMEPSAAGLPKPPQEGGTLAAKIAAGGIPAEAAHKFVQWYLEPDPEALDRSVALGMQGYRTSPLSYTSTAPGLSRMWTVADRFGVNPIPKEAERYYRETGTQILHGMGEEVDPSKLLTHPSAKVSFAPAGRAIQEQVTREYQTAAIELETRRKAIEEGLHLNRAVSEADMAALKVQHNIYRAARDKAISQDMNSLEKISTAGGQGDLSPRIAELIATYDDDAQQAFGKEAGIAYATAGNERRIATPVVGELKKLYAEIPDQLKEQAPAIVRKFAATQGETREVPVYDPHGIAIGARKITEPPTLTFEEAHQALKWARGASKFSAISQGMRAGATSYTVHLLDKFVHARGEGVPENWAAASDIIKGANAEYKRVRDQLKTSLVKSIATDYKNTASVRNPAILARMVFGEKNEVAAQTARDILGPELFGQVALADLRHVLDKSRDVRGMIDDSKLADELNARRLNRTLDMWQAPEVKKLALDFVEKVQKRDGKLTVLPTENDSFSTILKKFNEADARLQQFVKEDPATAFEHGFNQMMADFNASKDMLSAERKADPFAMFTEANAEVSEAAKRITQDENLLTQFAKRFPEDKGPQMEFLRRAFWRGMLQRDFFADTGRPSKEVARLHSDITGSMTDGMLNILAPGQTRQEIADFAKNVQHLLKQEADISFSLQAGAAAKNPAGELPIPKSLHFVKHIPTWALRPVLTKYLNKLTDYASDPGFHTWVKYGAGGSPEAQAVVKAFLNRMDSEAKFAGPLLKIARAVGDETMEAAMTAKTALENAPGVGARLAKRAVKESVRAPVAGTLAGGRALNTPLGRTLSALGVRQQESDDDQKTSR